MAIKREKVIKAAEKYVARGKLENAIKEYRKVLKEDPSDTNTLNRVGDLYARLEKYDEAVKLFSQIAEKYTRDGFFVKAIAIYKKIIKLDPTALRVYERLAELYHRQGLITEARSQYQVLADYYQKHENATSAITIYQRMSEMEPDNPAFHLKLAELYASQRLIDKSQREFKALGDLLVANDSADEAVQAYVRGIELAPDNLTYVRETVLHLHANDAVGASASLLGRATELNPEAQSLAAEIGFGAEPEPEPEPVVETASDDDLGEAGDGYHPTDGTFSGRRPDVDDTDFGAPFESPQPAADFSFDAPASGSFEVPASGSFEAPAPASFETPDAAPSFNDPPALNDPPAFNDPPQAVVDSGEFTFELDDPDPPPSQVTPPAEVDAPTASSFDGSGVAAGRVPSFDLDDESMPSSQVVPPADLADTAGQAFKIDLSELKGIPDMEGEAPAPPSEGDPELSEVDFAPDAAGYAAPEPSPEPVPEPEPEPAPPAAPAAFEVAPAPVEPTAFDAAPTPVEPAPTAEPEVEIEWSADGMDDLDVTLPTGQSVDVAPPANMAPPQAVPQPPVPEPPARQPVAPPPVPAPAPVETAPEPVAPEPAAPEPAAPEPATPEPAAPEPAAAQAQPFSLSFSLDDEDDGEEDDLDATRPATSVAAAQTPDPVPPPPPAPAPPAVRRDEDLVAEAAVFAKYGLVEKAVDRLDDLLAGNPTHLEGLALRAQLDLDAGHRDQALARAAELKAQSEQQGDFSHWQAFEQQLAAAGLSLEPAAAEPEPEPEPAKPAEDDRIAQLLEDLSLDSFDSPSTGQSVVDSLLEQDAVEAAPEPAPSSAAPPPVPSAAPSDKISLVNELSFDDLDVAEPVGAPAETLPPPSEDVMDGTGMSWLDEPTPAPDTGVQKVDTSTMFDDEDDFFDLAAELEEELGAEAATIDESMLTSVESQEQTLEEVIEGFKQGVAENLSPEDYQTHYNLGMAYYEMGLMDEAIGEFQLASKDERYLVECASMLGICFQEKGLPELAVRWYKKGLASPTINEDVTLGLLYDMGAAYESQGDVTSAYKTFVEVYGLNTNFRDVSTRLQQLAPG